MSAAAPSGRSRLYDPLLALSPVLDPILDPLTVRASRSLVGWWKGPPGRVAQVRAREAALEAVVERYEGQAQALAAAVMRREADAIASYEALLARAVHELRTDAEAAAAKSVGQRLAHAIDRALYADHAEWLDDPSFDSALRVRALDRLDRMNEALGNYDAFFSVVAPMVERARACGVARPVIVDLASGHAMFAVILALRLGAREGRVRVIATDLVSEYLDLGRERARALGMDDDAISFLEQDALDLRALPQKVGAPIDVVCCTQSVHHFSPGLVARMFGEAFAVARHGAVVVDGERNVFALALVAVAGVVLGRGSVPFLHDAIVSMRRMYTEQELALIGRLAPRSDGRVGIPATRGWITPGHVWLASGGA